MSAIANPPSPDAHQDRPEDKLVHRIGGLLMGDAKLASLDWNSYALVALYDEGAVRLSGFAYLQTGDHVAATPDDPQLPGAIRDLRNAMRQAGAPAWGACVIRIVRATRKITVEFEYDDPARWAITPATLALVAQRARPD